MIATTSHIERDQVREYVKLLTVKIIHKMSYSLFRFSLKFYETFPML